MKANLENLTTADLKQVEGGVTMGGCIVFIPGFPYPHFPIDPRPLPQLP